MITYIEPPQNIVYNMDKKGIGHIPIKFAHIGTNVKLSLTNERNKEVKEIKLNQNGNDYQALLDLPNGEYSYVITSSEPMPLNTTPTPYYFSVGIVLIVVGHSLVSNNGEKWVTSKRVRIVENYTAKKEQKWRDESKYINQQYRTCQEIWEEKKNLPDGERREYEIGVWGNLAQIISERDDCNVAIINTAMGGSSVQMWADEAMNRPFVHGFGEKVPGVPDGTLYDSGIPYFHFQNVLKHIVNQTGVSAVLVQHGENDMGKDPATLAKFYDDVILTARKNAAMPNLPFVLAKSAWLLDVGKGHTQLSIDNTLAAVDLTIKNTAKTYLGPDTHLLPMSLRGLNDANDGHFNADGGKEVARLWSVVLSKDFLASIAPTTTTDATDVVDNPLITANNNPKYEQFMLPSLMTIFVVCVLVFLRLFGIKTPKLLSPFIVGLTFSSTFLIEKLIKADKE